MGGGKAGEKRVGMEGGRKNTGRKGAAFQFN